MNACPSNVNAMFESYAQNGEDVVLWRVLGDVHAGTYVDVGAADPDVDSVTKAFYLRGWTGVNVEPIPYFAKQLRMSRPRDVVMEECAGDVDGTMVLHHVVGTGLSTLVALSAAFELADYDVEDIRVPVRKLDVILHDAGLKPDDPIHFLKIDVEGFELQVLLGLDLHIWRPWVVVVESTLPNSTVQVHEQWEHLLVDAGYTFCLFDGLNRFYASPERPELAKDLAYPVCVFDQPFMTPAHGTLLREYDNLLVGKDLLQGAHTKALASYDRAGAELQRTLDSYDQLEATYHTTIDAWKTLESTYNALLAVFEQIQNDHDGVLAQVAQLREANGSLTSERKVFQADVARLCSELAELAAERDTLRAGIARMGCDFDDVRAQRDEARHEVRLILQTLSWRVTAPLRAVRRLRAR